jgi:hypothetical protein
MTWVKLDDGLPDHAKVADLSDAAFRAYITALCFCSRNLTDGELTESQIRRIGMSKSAREELLEATLIEPREGGGAVLHDFLEYQPSRAQVHARRKAVTERVQRFREHNRNGNAVTTELQERIIDELVTPPPSRPVPSDPERDPEGTPLVPPVGGKRERRRRKSAIPEDWSPVDRHRAKAEELRLDLDLEAQKFRNHALANDRLCAQWDRAFDNWLLGSRSPSRPANNAQRPTRAGDLTDALFERAARLRAEEKVG